MLNEVAFFFCQKKDRGQPMFICRFHDVYISFVSQRSESSMTAKLFFSKSLAYCIRRRKCTSTFVSPQPTRIVFAARTEP